MSKIFVVPALLFACAACTPTVQIQAPDKPIEINLNVKIEQHVRVSIEKDVSKSIQKNRDIF
ncbi:MAG: YnbE family lipoprotein [Alphaproteobacteria bacterium]|nr:YnbE family lipoprotein [Alphaproteobacteria bacterium]